MEPVDEITTQINNELLENKTLSKKINYTIYGIVYGGLARVWVLNWDVLLNVQVIVMEFISLTYRGRL